MKRLLLTALLLLGAAGAPAETVEKTLEAAKDGTVSISNIAGEVDVRGWSRSAVELSAELGSDVEELIFERDGNHVEIKVEVRKRGRHDLDSDLVVYVPERSSLKVGTVSADITVQGVLGLQKLNTVSGDIETEAFAADIEVESVSGDIDVQGDGKKANTRLNTVSGDVDAERLAGEVTAGSVSGDIHLLDGVFERARINTTNGDVVFRSVLEGDGRLDIETINGDLDVRFQRNVSARFDIETFNGDIRNCFGPEPVRTSKYAPGRELNFSHGGGSARVTIQTLNGDLTLCDK